LNVLFPAKIDLVSNNLLIYSYLSIYEPKKRFLYILVIILLSMCGSMQKDLFIFLYCMKNILKNDFFNHNISTL